MCQKRTQRIKTYYSIKKIEYLQPHTYYLPDNYRLRKDKIDVISKLKWTDGLADGWPEGQHDVRGLV